MHLLPKLRAVTRGTTRPARITNREFQQIETLTTGASPHKPQPRPHSDFLSHRHTYTHTHKHSHTLTLSHLAIHDWRSLSASACPAEHHTPQATQVFAIRKCKPARSCVTLDPHSLYLSPLFFHLVILLCSSSTQLVQRYAFSS